VSCPEPSDAVRVRMSWVTSVADNADHAVTDDAMVAGMSTGVYEAVCGAGFVPAAMIEPPRPPCSRCVAFLRAQRTMRDFHDRLHRRHRKPGLLARVFGRHRHRQQNAPVVPSLRSRARDDRLQPLLDRGNRS
jgi:hypothetical protein